MLKRVSLLAIAAAALLVAGYADQSENKIVIPVHRVSPANGQQMYMTYCAPCHGTDGRGNGPAANSMQSQPVDLTTLARTNHGKYPDAHVVAVLRHGAENAPAHSATMPKWGPLLAKLTDVNQQEKELRISNLSRYLQSIQVK